MASRQTSKPVASSAGRVLANPSSTPSQRSAAASALTQYRTATEATSRAAASKASAVMRSPFSTPAQKSAAASALSQRAK